MYIDPEIYNPKMLRKNDKAKYDVIDETVDNILSTDVIEDFIEAKEVIGETIQKIYRDVLTEYVSFLKERAEYCKVDFLIEVIENYPDDEVELRLSAVQTEKNEKKKPNNVANIEKDNSENDTSLGGCE